MYWDVTRQSNILFDKQISDDRQAMFDHLANA